jgi:mRNA-degrading endonuclease toxin of MazEF toxin-antitoxin module
MVICPITSQYKPYPFIVVLPELLLSKPSYVLADQVKSLDWKKRNVLVGLLKEELEYLSKESLYSTWIRKYSIRLYPFLNLV